MSRFPMKCLLAGLAATFLLAPAASAAPAAEKEIVRYRLAQWETVHFDDADRAKTHFTTVKKLGCEAKQSDHGGHIDVTYRCPEWRQMALKTHKAAHQWEDWLKASGFQTRHEH